MATFSITANLAIRDSKEAKAFVSVLLSDSRPRQFNEDKNMQQKGR